MNIIMGAGDFAREVYEYHKFMKVPVDGFYDEVTSEATLRNKPIYKNLFEIPDINNKKFIVGTGNPKVNKKFFNLILNNNLKFSNPIICDSYVGENVIVGLGSVICPKSVLTCDIVLGNFSVINISCTIGHDCVISDFCVLSPNCSLSGHTKLEELVSFGTAALTIPKIFVRNESIIGASATVTRNIDEPGTYVGSPAKKIK